MKDLLRSVIVLLALLSNRFFVVQSKAQGDGPLTYPCIFNIEGDSKELWNMNVTYAWVGVPFAKLMAAYTQSIKQYPNIEPGAKRPSH
ncbi:hypothetical protein V6R21_02575 [Limibacter armeniacum]|uniref:hypothetical protein n=1 Tax=Limibacter armeniacum TaxID=466084 RepID=UPI002FE60D12